MTIQQCRYATEIARCGSFNEAAKQLFVAQSSLSVSVKALEKELNIKIFERQGSGVFLTEEGNEFVRYARQLVELHDFVINRYTGDVPGQTLHVATQHYDFVADIFGKLLNDTEDKQYKLSLREMKTYDVIHETQTAGCDIGIIAIKGSDYGIMERYLSQRGLVFTPLLKALPHVFLRKDHPAAGTEKISLGDLRDYPYVAYEQGEHDISFFTEEISADKTARQVEISDRASLMNVLLATNCYTVGTGIMPSLLNDGRIISVPLENDDHYMIGYIMRNDRKASQITELFIDLLKTGVAGL
ncbi:MAG: LysR family transcriptional regulator [Oscillospiraceae bacterium]|nr:LysR family transcriptional regulator [Oscillospiraceae bacterium]